MLPHPGQLAKAASPPGAFATCETPLCGAVPHWLPGGGCLEICRSIRFRTSSHSFVDTFLAIVLVDSARLMKVS